MISGILTRNWIIVLLALKGPVNIPFDSVTGIEEIEPIVLVEQLLEITKNRAESRPGHLSWLLSSARPVKESASDWFYDELSRVNSQIAILSEIFPNRSQSAFADEAGQICIDFEAGIRELEDVLEMVQSEEATKIADVYHKKGSFPPQKDEPPNILSAIIKMFDAVGELDSLTKKIDSTVSYIQDMMTISRISRSTVDK